MNDVIIVYSKKGLASKENQSGNYKEIEYVLASLLKFCKSWLRKIFIIGDQPPSMTDKIVYLSCGNPYTHIKDANIIHKIKFAIENIPDLSEDFLVVSDDQIVTRDTAFEDFVPMYLEDRSAWTVDEWKRLKESKNSASGKAYEDAIKKTLDKFSTKYFMQPHIWTKFNKAKFLLMCNDIDYCTDIGCVVFSLYYNYIKEVPVKTSDFTFFGSRNTNRETITNLIVRKTAPRFLSWSDSAFDSPIFREFLNSIVGFKCNNKLLDLQRQFANLPILNGVLLNPYFGNYSTSTSWN